MAEQSFRIPLHPDFRFMHEPQSAFERDFFIGRKEEIEELVRRLQYSDGGSFLITGYRGVGKTSFVNKALDILSRKVTLLDVHLNLARALEPAELMHLIVRHLYDRLIEKDIYRSLSHEIQHSLTLAYQRTSANVVRKLSQNSERGLELGDWNLHGIRLPAQLKLSAKRSRSIDLETSFMAYDDKSAEHDIIGISRVLAAGVPRREAWIQHLWRRVRHTNSPRIPLKIVFVFDELDKLDEFERAKGKAARAASSVEQMLGGLKNLFTTSGICFVFVAGKDLHEKWLLDLRRGDSIYESIFSYDRYLPCMWSEFDQICDRFAAADGAGKGSNPGEVLHILKQYLRYKGRGTPRRFLRSFYEMVKWRDDRPEIPVQNEDLRRITFFARLNETLEKHSDELFGTTSDDPDGTRQDRRRLGVYYVVDWILRKGKSDFSATEVVAASHELSARIALAEEIASGAVAALLEVLVQADYIEVVPVRFDDVIVGNPAAVSEKRYRLTARRIAEISGIESVLEREAPEARAVEAPSAGAPTLPRIGRFIPETVLGTGGMGTVYRAFDPRNQGYVALKVMHEFMQSSSNSRERFLREIKALETLRHENIVTFLEAGETDSRLYLAMELIEGTDLKAILANLGRLSPDLALAVLLPIANAIAFAHNRGFVRLDLKPGNVQVSNAGRVLLMDLGIARTADASDAVTRSGQLLGTPIYMAPEQIMAGRVDARTDIYAYGVMLYEALAGTPPFAGEELYDIIRKHLEDVARRPSELNPQIPDWLDAVVMKCLAKDPGDRFQSMEKVVEEVNSTGMRWASPLTIGTLAQQARNKVNILESSRNARTLTEPGGATENFRARPYAPPQRQVGSPTGPLLTYGDAERPDDTWVMFKLAADGPTRIGSAADNDIVVKRDDISRYHARIERSGNGFVLVDLNSNNGTYLNGERILSPRQLNPDDRFQIGKMVFCFEG